MKWHRTMVALALANTSAVASEVTLRAGDVHVTDGDTVRVDNHPYRLVGFDAPETWRARCSGEALLGKAAADRLQQLVD
ncbi:MAG: hypothetical protein JOZ16_01310, partial [Methylobacteriaceae bacterium]|nr:hypothetical protein [Methylobacteriaceae bacterium]